jgi:hypothetical protein
MSNQQRMLRTYPFPVGAMLEQPLDGARLPTVGRPGYK